MPFPEPPKGDGFAGMKVIALKDGLGLAEGKEYEILEESAGYYKVIIDNGNRTFRRANLFKKQVKENETD